MNICTPLDFGQAIRNGRRRLRLDQSRLAEMIGVSRKWIVEVEKGKPGAEIGLILRALAALDLGVQVAPITVPSERPKPDQDDLDALIEQAMLDGWPEAER